MGNSMNKEKGEETVDGGQLVPHGVYKGAQDWDSRIVRKLIIERKLAPYYKGLADYDEGWDEVTLTTHNLPKNGEVKKGATFNGECHAQGSQALRRSAALNTVVTTKGKEVPTAKSLEAQLYKGAVECPICFLYYPRNINHSRCCDQPICTECFVQIKRPESGTLGANNSPAVCPFCVEPNFGVCYKPPPFSAGIGSENMSNAIANFNIPQLPTSSSSTSLNVPEGKTRRRSVSHKNPDVVTTDQIRPDWAARALLQTSRQQLGTRRSQTTSSGTPRRIVIRPQGGSSTPSTTATTGRRNNPPNIASEYGGYLAAMRMGTDLEELMVMEAIRLSLLEQDERDREEREERERTDRLQDENSNNVSSSEDSASGTITNPHLSSNEEGVNEEVTPYESQQRNENENENLIADNTQSEIETQFSEQIQTYHSDDDEISSTSHSHGYTSTNVSTPITASTEGGTITSTSAPSSSTGSELSSPSTMNSTNDALSSPSYSRNNDGTSEITEIVEGSSEQVLYNTDSENVLPSFELGHEEGQTSEHANDIKKPDVIILPSTSSLVEEAIVRNEADDDT